MPALAAQTIASHASNNAGAPAQGGAKSASGLDTIFASLLAEQADAAGATGDSAVQLAATGGAAHLSPQALAAKRIAQLLNGSALLPASNLKASKDVAGKRSDSGPSREDQTATPDGRDAIQRLASTLVGRKANDDGETIDSEKGDGAGKKTAAAAQADGAAPDRGKHEKKKSAAADAGAQAAQTTQQAQTQTALAALATGVPGQSDAAQPASSADSADGAVRGLSGSGDRGKTRAPAGQPDGQAPEQDAAHAAEGGLAQSAAAKAGPQAKQAQPAAQATGQASAESQAQAQTAPHAQSARAKAVQDTLAALGAAPVKAGAAQARNAAVEPGQPKADSKSGKTAKGPKPQSETARTGGSPQTARTAPVQPAQPDQAAGARPSANDSDAKPARNGTSSHDGKAEIVKTAAAPQPAIQTQHAATPATPPTAVAATAQAPGSPSAPAPLQAQLQVAAHSDPNAVPLSNLGALAINIAAHSKDGAKHFDIALHPQEYGSIHVHLSVDHTGAAQAHLTADNHETLQLLQRDAQHLERSLKDAGLNLAGSGLNFSLKGQQQQNSGGHSGRGSARGLSISAIAATGDSAEAANTGNHLAGGDARLDIRV